MDESHDSSVGGAGGTAAENVSSSKKNKKKAAASVQPTGAPVSKSKKGVGDKNASAVA